MVGLKSFTMERVQQETLIFVNLYNLYGPRTLPRSHSPHTAGDDRLHESVHLMEMGIDLVRNRRSGDHAAHHGPRNTGARDVLSGEKQSRNGCVDIQSLRKESARSDFEPVA